MCCEIDGTNILDPVNSGGKLHGDIVALRVTKDGGTEETIPIRVNSTGFDITHSGGKLLSRTNVARLFSDSSYALPSPGSWVVYLKTNIKPYDPAAALPHTYRIRLADTKNLMSGAKETHTLGYSVDTSGSSEAWKKVRKAVTDVAADGVITLSGTVNATDSSGNHGQIEISKNLTIQGAPGNSPVVLDAHHLGLASSSSIADSHRIFTVKGAVEVTLKDLTLKRGKDAVDAGKVGSGGGGIWASANANLTLINVTVEDCISKAHGGGIRYDHGTGNKRLTMINCTIKNNTVQDDGPIGGSSTGGGISLPWASYTAVIDGCRITGNKIDMSAKTGSAPLLEAEGCGLACSAKPGSMTIIKGHTVIENNQCIPHALKPCECKGMGIFCGGGPLTIGETGKDNDESPEILNHGNPIPTNVTVAGTALYIKKDGTVRWLRGKIHDNGTDPNNSIKNAGGTLSNLSETSPS